MSGASRVSLVHIDLTFKCEDVGNCHSGCVEGSEARYKLWWRVDAGERKSHLCCVSGDKDQAPPPAPKEKGERRPQLNNLLQEKCFILLFTRMLKHIRDLFSDDKSSLIFKYESCCYYSYPSVIAPVVNRIHWQVLCYISWCTRLSCFLHIQCSL